MTKKAMVLRWTAFWLFGAVLHGSLLFWCRFNVDDDLRGMAVALLAQSCGLIAIFVLLTEVPGCWKSFWAVAGAFILAVLTTSTIGTWAFQSGIEGPSWWLLARWQGLQALPLLALAVSRRLWTTTQTAGLEILVGGTILLMLPFLLERGLTSGWGAQFNRDLLRFSFSLSAWPQACHEFLNQDIFKAEGIYRAFRVGERIYRYPSVAESAKVQGALAVVLLGFGAMGAIFRRLVSRLWTGQAGFAEIGK